jgi:hypothetical protein
MDLDRDGAKLADVLTAVVGAEVEISATRHDGSDKGARSAPVAPVSR